MSSAGTNIRVVISTESNEKLKAIQARLMGRGKPAGKREAIEYAIALAVNWKEPETKPYRDGLTAPTGGRLLRSARLETKPKSRKK